MTELEKNNLYQLIRTGDNSNIKIAKAICQGLNIPYKLVEYGCAKDACGVGPGDIIRLRALERHRGEFIGRKKKILNGIEYLDVREIKFIDQLPNSIKFSAYEAYVIKPVYSTIMPLDERLQSIINLEHKEGRIVTLDALDYTLSGLKID